MFAGEHFCKLDEKGRFILPQPMREVLDNQGKRLVYLKGPESCLWAYTHPEWTQILEKSRAGLDEEESRLFMHHIVSEMTMSDVDKGGRVLIPGKMRKHLNLDIDQEVVLIGLYQKLEMWSPSAWRHYLKVNEEKLESAHTRFMELL